MNDLQVAQEAMSHIRAIYEDGTAKIGSTEYTFHKMTHTKRRDVFAYWTTVQDAISARNFGFMSTPDFERVMKIIEAHVTVDGVSLDKSNDHWDNHTSEYITFVTTALAVVSFPFLPGSLTGLQ